MLVVAVEHVERGDGEAPLLRNGLHELAGCEFVSEHGLAAAVVLEGLHDVLHEELGGADEVRVVGHEAGDEELWRSVDFELLSGRVVWSRRVQGTADVVVTRVRQLAGMLLAVGERDLIEHALHLHHRHGLPCAGVPPLAEDHEVDLAHRLLQLPVDPNRAPPRRELAVCVVDGPSPLSPPQSLQGHSKHNRSPLFKVTPPRPSVVAHLLVERMELFLVLVTLEKLPQLLHPTVVEVLLVLLHISPELRRAPHHLGTLLLRLDGEPS
mmetsp:Transcript_14853/g.58260  ORF Transcript_14853/g.58260 Transcript_14853/m.58260 type:complete len:267 (+) Transcript_14853:69-869(+)